MSNDRWVVVTDKLRGIYFGRLAPEVTEDSRNISLLDARTCYRYIDHAGIGDLAVTGPLDGSQICPTVPRMSIADRQNIYYCTAEAVERWRAARWDS